ncbi:uncharacterized protein LOC129940564 [Eupeodes corollae]|uniref:uncharacterized protein LOC129940564 n=1 Tax=Eupeodes corollae TaxID=290404 RepID=UPI0024911041|nr:uncharacterized protein LOC129940564 [Eupeodes corollae]
MYNNLDDTFSADSVEDVKLKGNYRIETFFNNHSDLGALVEVPSYHCKAIFFKGNVLYKADEPNIIDYIDIMKKFTYTEPDKKIERNRQQRVGGTICPTSEDIYEIDDKIFSLYGRSVNRDKKDKCYGFLYDHNYAFKIVDKNTQILYAFGLYR